MLPAAVGWIGRFVEWVAAVSDVTDEGCVDAADVDIEGGHSGGWHALERRDEPGHAAVVTGADDVNGPPILKTLDRLDEPDRDVTRVHDLGQTLNQRREFQGA